MLNFNASSKYQTVSTNDLIANLKASENAHMFNWAGMTYKKTTNKNTKHIVEIPLKCEIVVNGDKCIPKLLLINSFNRESSLFIGVGIYRFVCSNGLVVGQNFYSEKVRHIQGPKIDEFLDTYKTKVDRVVAYINNNLVEKLDTLGTTEVTTAKVYSIIDQLEEKKQITKKAAERTRTMYQVGQFYRAEDRANKNNLWGLWNVINEQIEETRTTRTSDITVFNKNQKLLDNLITLAA